MSEHSPANVLAAYEMLLEELDEEIAWTNRTGAQAFAGGEHEAAGRALERAQGLASLRTDLLALQRRLRELVQFRETLPETRQRLKKGLMTPQEAYRVPILGLLVEMGGSGQTGAVLDRVYELMKDALNEYDLAPLPSDENAIRWRRTAQWCRNSMREEDLIKNDSPHGTWEISDKGREWLETNR